MPAGLKVDQRTEKGGFAAGMVEDTIRPIATSPPVGRGGDRSIGVCSAARGITAPSASDFG